MYAGHNGWFLHTYHQTHSTPPIFKEPKAEDGMIAVDGLERENAVC